MDQTNHLCDEANCGKAANVFGIKGKPKVKYCHQHAMLLIRKKVASYDISGYNFISSFEDLPIYEERKRMTERGLGNLTTLESQLNSELYEALRVLEDNEKKAIAIVFHSYQEIRLQVQRKYDTSKQQLQAMRHNFGQYLDSKQNELQGNAHLLCGEVISPFKFLRMVAEDCMLEIAQAIFGSWRVSIEDVDASISILDESKRTDILKRLTSEVTDELKRGHTQISLQFHLYAHALGWNGDFGKAKRANLENQIERVKELLETFQLATNQSDDEKAHVKSTAIECLQAGLTAKSELDIPQSFHWLQNAWGILEKSRNTGKETTLVGLALWEVVGLHFGKYAEADSILQHCYDIEGKENPLSEDAMKVNNSIAGVLYHSGNWNCAVEMCTWVLRTFSSTSHAAEHFWTTLHYLTHSNWLQGKKVEAQTVVEEWKCKRMNRENEHSKVLKLTVIAQYAQEQGNDVEAEKLLIEAADMTDHYFPTSVLAALDYHLLGQLYYDLKRFSEAEERYRKAKTIYEAVSPQSVHAPINLYNMGRLYYELKRFSEAEEYYNKAKAIYEAVSPQSESAANNLYNIGRLYYDLKRFSEAEAHYKKAKAIYEAVSPLSVIAANNLNSLGLLYDDLKRFIESEEHYRKAKGIYEEVSPHSVNAAINLNNLGILYKALKRFSEAEEHYRKAKAIYEKVSPQSESAANNLNNLGLLCDDLKRFSEAEAHYKKAKAIYEAVSPQSESAAINLYNMGRLYYDLKCFSDSEEHYRKAKAIYEAVSPQSVSAAINLNSMGILYKALKRFSEAEEHYRKAKAIYEAVSPQSESAANNLDSMGLLYYHLKRSSEAEAHYRKANEIYEAVAPQSLDAASNLYNMGLLSYDLKRFSEAEKHYRKAKAIYDEVSPQSESAANNLNNLGLLYDDLRRFSEAEEHYIMAKAIYEAVSPQSESAAINLCNMGRLCEALRLFSEAEEHYIKAKSIYEAVSPLSVSAANIHKNLGRLYEAMGKNEDAFFAFNAARTIFIDIHLDSEAKDAENNISRLQPGKNILAKVFGF